MPEFASKGVGTAGLTTGIIGSTLGVLNGGGGGILGNLFGNGVQRVITSEDMPVTRYDAGLSAELAASKAENGLLKSQVYTDQKITETYSALKRDIEGLEREVRRNKDEQTAINMQQAVYNGTNTATLQCMQNQIAQLMGLTALKIPNTSVCPGWGGVTVTPEAAAAAAAG